MGKRERKAPRSLKKASQPDISESIAKEATPGPPVLPKLTLQLPKQPSPSPSLQEDSDPPITPPPPFTADKAQVRDIVNAILGVQKKNSTISISSDSEATSTLSKATSKRKGAVSDISTASTQPGLDEGEDEVSEDEPDEEEDELDEEDNEPSDIDLPFSIPSDGTNSTLLVRSDITFKGLMNQLADELSVAPKAVKVAYRFSIEPRSAPWSHIQNEGHLSDLLKKAWTAIEKQKKSKSTRVFAVELKDLAPLITDHDMKGDKKKSRWKKKKKRSFSDSSDDTDIDPSKVAEKKKSATQWISEIEKDNACKELLRLRLIQSLQT